MFVGKYLDFIHKNQIKSQLLNHFNNKSKFDSRVKIQREDPTWNCELIHDRIIDRVAHGTLSYGISEMVSSPNLTFSVWSGEQCGHCYSKTVTCYTFRITFPKSTAVRYLITIQRK